MAPTMARRSHVDNVDCETPTSFDNEHADLPFGPAIFATIFRLNFSE